MSNINIESKHIAVHLKNGRYSIEPLTVKAKDWMDFQMGKELSKYPDMRGRWIATSFIGELLEDMAFSNLCSLPATNAA